MTTAQSPDTTHFNADEMAAALEVPTLTVGNLRYRGRLLSIEEWLPWWDRLLTLEKELAKEKTGDKNIDMVSRFHALGSFYAEYLRVVFPRNRFRWWAPDPVKHLTAMPFVVVEEAIVRFFYLQAVAAFGKDQIEMPIRSELPGTQLPQPTPSAPVEA